MTASMISLSIGTPKVMLDDGLAFETGICKESVRQAVLTKEGFEGDRVANTRFHGGLDRALCVYPFEHYKFWEEEFKVVLPNSAFGENLTLMGMQEMDVYIGDVIKIGEAIVQISQGRIPCQTISIRNGVKSFLSRVVETGYTGYFCRVLEEGLIEADSTITLLGRHPKQVSIHFANLTLFQEDKNIDHIKRILEVDCLASVWREKLERKLEL